MRTLSIILLAFAVIACSPTRRALEQDAPRETVLAKGQAISAMTRDYGRLRVTYVDPTTRTIEIEGYDGGFERTMAMRVRHERFAGDWTIGNGVLGIYHSGNSRELPRGARRVVYLENEKEFSSAEEMWRFLKSGSAVYDRSCSADGLLLSLSIVERRNQIGIEVYRLFINGSSPQLPSDSPLFRIGVESSCVGDGDGRP